MSDGGETDWQCVIKKSNLQEPVYNRHVDSVLAHIYQKRNKFPLELEHFIDTTVDANEGFVMDELN